MQNRSPEHVIDTQMTEVVPFDITPYIGGKPFSLEQSTRRIRRHIDTIDVAIFKIGKELIWVKTELPHGEFIHWLENEMKFPKRRAQEFMQIARWVIESKSPHARAFLRRIAGKSKVKMLMAVANTTDQDVDEAMETGHFWGRPIDEIKDTPIGMLRGNIAQSTQKTNNSKRISIKNKIRESMPKPLSNTNKKNHKLSRPLRSWRRSTVPFSASPNRSQFSQRRLVRCMKT